MEFHSMRILFRRVHCNADQSTAKREIHIILILVGCRRTAFMRLTVSEPFNIWLINSDLIQKYLNLTNNYYFKLYASYCMS